MLCYIGKSVCIDVLERSTCVEGILTDVNVVHLWDKLCVNASTLKFCDTRESNYLYLIVYI